MELIDKDKIVMEIEKRIKETESMKPKFDQFWAGQISAFKGILKILDTLEVKDVVAEQEGICNGILNTITGDTWHIKIPLNKAGLKHGDKVKIFIAKGK